MSASQYQRQLESKRKQRAEAETKAGAFRSKESTKRAAAGKARQSAVKTKSEATFRSKMNEAERRETEAVTAGKEANRWETRAADYRKAERLLQEKLTRAEKSEAAAADHRQRQMEHQAAKREAAERSAVNERLSRAESSVGYVLSRLPEPKPEKLRILMLGASSDGDLRIGREMKRIQDAIRTALLRDAIEFDVRPAATPDDLLDGISQFRPHIIHFSGHSDEEFLVLEADRDEGGLSAEISARAFASAVRATDTPPLLVVLNSCSSASQIDALVEQVVPFAIGMSDTILDGDAINYAARFYANIANGQSLTSAHQAGKARLEMDGAEGCDLPTLASAEQADPVTTILVHQAD
ncbi:hypothetical protein [Corynebacterium flavescens]|uniref:CHAT domain-containing protein n=2 Tax=Corynebacterium flavescens TaxID=28028 RepID=A0A1L7CPZ3_CORFL|nr:hypothetical protein [Corynebacterium flavescens]APT87903.1 hypothetical protein CFLV_12590 [Corynebacterium flavescens]KAA8719523.1 hypothetical protein F4V60_12090 [Corynebacterium flavescens]MDN6227556.1 hypothetical protein [Corynebacterium flavescens]GEB97512.1 CHAT domain-containing protein [Corynebacterium flavescens]